MSTAAYARFLPAWQQVGAAKVSGIDGLGRRDRTACGRAHSGVGGRTTGLRPAGPRLLTGDARRTAGRGRGHLVRRRADRRQRRLDRLSLRRLGAVDDDGARRDRVHRHPPGDHGNARARRGLLLPPTRRRRRSRPRRFQDRTVGTDLGGLGHRRHLRPGACDVAWHRPPRRRAPSAATSTAVEPLQRGARPDPHVRADGRGPLVGAARGRTGIDHPRPLPGRAAAQPLRGSDEGLVRGRARRIRDALQGAQRIRGCRPMPARLLRRVARRRPVRGRVDRGPAAHLPRRRRPGAPRLPGRRARGGRPRQPLRRALCRGRPTAHTGLAARRAPWW